MRWVALGCVGCLAPSAGVLAEDVARVERVAARVDGTRLRGELEDLVAAHESDQERHHSRLAGEVVRAAMDALPAPWRVLEEHDDTAPATRNLVAELPGRTAEWVLVTAHYDAFFGGANDNSSGTSAVLEIARALPLTPDRGIRVVAFDQEEVGLVGSQRYYAIHGDEPIAAVFNLDCIGSFKTDPGSQITPIGFTYPPAGDFIAAYGNRPARAWVDLGVAVGQEPATAVSVFSVVGNERMQGPLLGSMSWSDHGPAWDRGIPAVMITDTTSLRWDEYHTEHDRPSVVVPEFHEAVTRWAAATVWLAANP